ncbi:MoxR family ATPase [Candidatus Poribacteria bacterium]|nr:MoxR family ATPase [Candidatus Poribacteria bacterium]MDE0689431.1 MoxR family ATPase [Candidatus Poribacteria bacterium]MXV85611.1 MoxR family ATPase [Candidatus Poribacteria bacterium]MYA58187.1 MoxR family ATPase [Candidatus Poribacteria bacterium]
MPATEEVQAIEELMKSQELILGQLKKVIVGQEDVINQMLMALFAGGHCLLEGVPGLAKTLMIRTLAQILNLKFKRIQFTPDLMPADITGTDVLEEDRTTGHRTIRFIQGPIFANILLADEINRTPPKTQAALLEAMQEYHVTAGGTEFALEQPFFVLATQNPIEQEGTYPLPEAQLDRFMFKIVIDYPTEAEETDIVSATTGAEIPELDTLLSGHVIVALHDIVRRVPAAENVVQYAVRIARATRPKEEDAPDFIQQWVRWGAGPRAGQYLILGAKARAILRGRYNASCEDVRSVAPAVLRHRILTNFHAEAEGVDSDTVIQRLLDTVQEPAARL